MLKCFKTLFSVIFNEWIKFAPKEMHPHSRKNGLKQGFLSIKKCANTHFNSPAPHS